MASGANRVPGTTLTVTSANRVDRNGIEAKSRTS